MKSRNSREEQRSRLTTPRLTKGSVLDDLGFSGAEALEIKVKAEIYRSLLHFIKEREFSQQELGTVLGIHQPDVSNLLNGRVSKFSVSRLIHFAGKLNLGAQVTLIEPKTEKVPTVLGAGRARKQMSVAAG